uniref:Uncharacterized protein n=1 Tax=Setaria viridis TaxID=4556 RepID=A0A4U6TFI6_SETVI|nr:hypothetical protein SEVIR_8G149150v2 [Setaria viridis]
MVSFSSTHFLLPSFILIHLFSTAPRSHLPPIELRKNQTSFFLDQSQRRGCRRLQPPPSC